MFIFADFIVFFVMISIQEGNAIVKEVFTKLRASDKTFASAESCTGGNIAHQITMIPGSSWVFRGAAVTYATETKTDVIGVPAEVIEQYGVVSSQVAEKMAEGVRQVMKSDYGVATTGVAGPDGGTEETPVGTVWIAVATPEKTLTHCLHLTTDRLVNIEQASFEVYQMLLHLL